MGIMKDLFSQLIEAFPQTCPHCEGELCDCIDFDKLNKAIDQITLIATINAQKKGGKNNESDLEGQYQLYGGEHTCQAVQPDRR